MSMRGEDTRPGPSTPPCVSRRVRPYFGVTASGDPDVTTAATTGWEYMPAGMRYRARRPTQYPSGDYEQYAYDSTGRFITSSTNDSGHLVTAEYEPGTGAQVWQEDRRPTCGVGCTNLEKAWTDVDGLGRPIATWVNRSTGATNWVKTKVTETIYTDAVVLGARTKVVEKGLIAYDQSRWTETETQLDGGGRQVQVSVKTGPSTPAAVTSYDYDGRGSWCPLRCRIRPPLRMLWQASRTLTATIALDARRGCAVRSH